MTSLIVTVPTWGAAKTQNIQRQDATPASLSIVKQLAPHMPPFLAVALMGTAHVPFKQPYRISTATMQNIQWGCFAASLVIIVGYIVYLHLKIKKAEHLLIRYANANDAAAQVNDEVHAADIAFVMERFEALISSLPADQQTAIRAKYQGDLKNPQSPLAQCLWQRNQSLSQRDRFLQAPEAGTQKRL